MLPEKQDEKKPYILLKYAEQKYLVPMGDTPAGNARRVIQRLERFSEACGSGQGAPGQGGFQKRGASEPCAVTGSFLFGSIGGLRKRGQPASRADRRACGVRSLHGLAPCVPASVFCGLFLPHAILYYKIYRDRIW